MTAPKIVACWNLADGSVAMLNADREAEWLHSFIRDRAPRRLAESGQRVKGGVWPEGHGVVEIEDIPTPDPLPEQWINVYARGQAGYANRLLADGWADAGRIALIHFGTRDGVDFAEVIRP